MKFSDIYLSVRDKAEPFFQLVDSSNCRDKENLKQVCDQLALTDLDFFIFLMNILIDLRINSLDRARFLEFVDNYTTIDLRNSPEEMARQLHEQIRKSFEPQMLTCKFKFVPDEEHVNVIPYDTFINEHLPKGISVTKDKFFYNYKMVVRRIEKMGVSKLQTPYRKSWGQKRIVWLAKRRELFEAAAKYSGDQATAINDILGLGLKDDSRPEKRTLLLYMIFPGSFKAHCFKPTFIEGPMWNYKGNFFANTIDCGGYGKTRSTYLGLFESSECVTDGLDSLTDEFKLRVLGYAIPKIDLSNMRDYILKRLGDT